MWEKIDTWVGKTLFVPIIIRICQKLKCTQQHFHRAAWALAWLTMLYFAESLGWIILIGLIALVSVISLALAPDRALPQGTTSRFWRMMWLALLMLDAAGITLDLTVGANAYDRHLAVVHILILFAEYAATIKTIPPLEDRERVGKLAPAKRSA